MDDLRFGAVARSVRKRLGLTQAEVSRRCGLSTSAISLIERGHCQTLSLKTLRQMAAALDMRMDLRVVWRGGELDRLMSRRHSALGESVASFLLSMSGWIVNPEVSFSIYGERGIIDLLAFHPASGHLLVIELKTEFVDVNEMLGTFHRKRRLAGRIAAERGWKARTVSAWLIVSDTHTNRRHAAEHRTLLRSSLPLDGRSLRSFLANPAGATAGMAFWPDCSGGRRRPGPKPRSTQ